MTPTLRHSGQAQRKPESSALWRPRPAAPAPCPPEVACLRENDTGAHKESEARRIATISATIIQFANLIKELAEFLGQIA